MSASMGSDTRSGIGARLRAGRERMGMTLLQVAEKLHVDPKVPESIETEQLESLGASVYVKGHLKRYAELVGEDTQAILDLYGTHAKPAMPDLTQLPKATRPADPRKLVVPSLVVLIGLVFVGVVWWILKGVQDGSLGAPVAPHVVESEVPPESDVATVPPATAPASARPASASGGERQRERESQDSGDWRHSQHRPACGSRDFSFAHHRRHTQIRRGQLGGSV
jgi:cytoskeleton protein RodZ